MNLREAAQQALVALEDPWSAGPDGVAAAIIALRAALAEATINKMETVEPSREQIKSILQGLSHCYVEQSAAEFLRVWIRDWTANKVAPPKRNPLPDEEIRRIDDATPFHEVSDWAVRFARAIERAHGIGGEE